MPCALPHAGPMLSRVNLDEVPASASGYTTPVYVTRLHGCTSRKIRKNGSSHLSHVASRVESLYKALGPCSWRFPLLKSSHLQVTSGHTTPRPVAVPYVHRTTARPQFVRLDDPGSGGTAPRGPPWGPGATCSSLDAAAAIARLQKALADQRDEHEAFWGPGWVWHQESQNTRRELTVNRDSFLIGC